jgi:hypothetical protein
MRGRGRWSALTFSVVLAGSALGVSSGSVAQEQSVLKAPVPAGITLKVIHGYNDPPPGQACAIGSTLDHCDNQKYGLDLELVGTDDRTILAPTAGTVVWEQTDTNGCIGMTTTDGLNLNLCHLATLDVALNTSVAQGDVLGTRSTSWVHLSIDDRRDGINKRPVPLTGRYALEGRDLKPTEGVVDQYGDGSVTFLSTNIVGGSSSTDPASGKPLGVEMTVPSTVAWSDTGLDPPAGSPLRITASGTVEVGDPIFRVPMTPDGCIGHQGFTCSMLIGRFDGGESFAVGSEFDEVVTGGRLELGTADAPYLGDNAGTWDATVVVDTGQPVSATIDSRQAWTDTGVVVPRNAHLHITAMGTVSIEPRAISVSPDGPAARVDQGGNAFSAPGLLAWSLVGRFGRDGDPFLVGSSWSGVSPGDRLYLGINDSYFDDNHGSWSVQVTD